MFYEVIYPLSEKCFPRIKVKLSSRDPSFMSPLVNHFLNLRKKATKKHDLELSNRLQEKINSLIRQNQMRAVRQESNSNKTGSKKWWETVNSITSRTKLNIPVSGKIDPNDINVHFQKINTDCNYKRPDPCEIPEGKRIPSLSTNMVRQFLDKLRKTAVGADDIPYWFWRNFSLDPTPIPMIERKTWLEILGTILQENPCSWDMHFNKLISKASRRMCIMRACKFYGMSREQLDLLFDSLIMSVLTYGVELWGCAYYNKYLSQIDKLVRTARKCGYTSKSYSIKDIIHSTVEIKSYGIE